MAIDELEKLWFCTCHKDVCEKHPRPGYRSDSVWEYDDTVLDKTDLLPAPPSAVNLEHGVLDLDTGVLTVFIPGAVIVETLHLDKKHRNPGIIPDRPPWSLICEAKSRIAGWL